MGYLEGLHSVDFGGCTTVGNNFVFLCLSGYPKLCHRANIPEGPFEGVAESHFYHGANRISASDSKLSPFLCYSGYSK